IVVGGAAGHAFADVLGQPVGLADVGEDAATTIEIEGIWRAFVEARVAVVVLAFVAALRFAGGVPVQVIDHEEIEETVAVDVHPDTAHRPEGFGAAAGESGFGGDVSEGTVAVVVVERIVVDAADEYVGEAVVIVVGDSNTRVVP